MIPPVPTTIEENGWHEPAILTASGPSRILGGRCWATAKEAQAEAVTLIRRAWTAEALSQAAAIRRAEVAARLHLTPGEFLRRANDLSGGAAESPFGKVMAGK